MELTYLDLINGFNNWCEDNYLDIKSQIIFFKILHLMNRSGWKEWTQISNMRLMDFCGIESDKSFIRLRDKLIEVGFIEYQKGKKSQPNKYKLCTGNFEKVKQKYTVKYTGKKESTNDSINDSTSVPHNKKEEKELRVKKDISKDISKEKHAYGSAKNVLLTDKQHTKLQQDYGSDLLEMVEYLSDYIAKKGGEIEKQDHNRVLRGWVKNAVRERKLKQQELELREKELEARKKRLEMGYPYPKHGANQGVKPDVEDKSTDINDWISKGAQNMKNAVLSLIDNTIRNAENYANFSNRDYKNSQGLLMCGNCHTPKQKFLDIDKSSSLYERYKGHPVPVVCQCRKELEEAERQRQKQIETEMLIEKFRKEGITDSNYLKYTFDFDDNKNPEISRVCKKYADEFSEMYKLGLGLIFCGQVGTGKTFYAGCIANAVISQARSVLMTNIPSLITKLGFNQEEKNYILNKISSVSLLVIDDLGVERDTPYSLEKVYEIIDTRYRAGKPLIITTNLKYKDMKNCEAAGYKRIYDRILQMCHPIAVIGDSRRKEKAEKSIHFINDFLGLNQTMG